MRCQEIGGLAVANDVSQARVRQGLPCLKAPGQEDTWELKSSLCSALHALEGGCST